jgi:hypothetical protein
MLLKIALTEPCTIEQISGKKSEVMIKTASGRVLIEPGSEKELIVQAEIKKHPNALFFRAKAIKADEPNSNGDSFSKKELLSAYKSFEGVPFFTNHENQDIEKAKGKIIFAEWDEEENSIYTIAFVDRDAYPHICRGIEQGYMTGVSMGAAVEYSICNICENKAERTEDYCEHIRNRKSRKFTGKARSVRTGEVNQFKDELVFEHNYGIKFIELSGVVDPACPSCHIEGIITNDNYLGKVANVEGYLRMVKSAALQKEASQEEIDQIEEMLGTLENIAVSLIKNRKQVEVEFASELVDIIANLQTWTDELVGAGYGSIESNVPGTYEETPEGDPMAEQPMEGMEGGLETAPREGMPAQAPAPTPVSAGQSTQAPGQPLVNTPQLPVTAPMRPSAINSSGITKIADEVVDRHDFGSSILQKAASLCGKMNKTGEKDMGKRRTVASKEKEKERVMKVLSSSWQEKQSFFKYIKEVPSIKIDNLKLSIKNRDDSFIIVAEDDESDQMQIWTYDDLTDDDKQTISETPKIAAQQFLKLFANKTNSREGVKRMSKETKQAGANTVLATPEVTIERQLEDKRSELYHGRTGEEKHVVTQKQLEGNNAYPRTGESEVLTEKQLDDADLKLNPRQDTEAQVTTEKQLEGSGGPSERTNEDKHTVTQDQLDREGYRTGNEPDVVIEKQLDNVDSAWARQANRDPSLFKSARDHMNLVVDAFAEVSLETGATPEELQEIASICVASTQSRVRLANTLVEEKSVEALLPFSKRASYWNSKNVRVATASTADVENSLVNKLRVIASDVTINPDTVIDAVDVLSDGEVGATSISAKVDEKLAEASSTEESRVNVKDELRNALKEAATENDSRNQGLDSDDEDFVEESDEYSYLGEDETVEANSKTERDAEREEILASLEQEAVEASTEGTIINPEKLNGADIVIETDFNELGTARTATTFRKDIVKFAKTALATESMKLASITNVTIDGNTIQIAVQTDTGEESVSIPIGEEVSPMEDEIVPEGDLAGEGLESGLGAEDDLMGNVNNMASYNGDRMKRKAQSPMGGGMGGAGGEVSAPGSPESLDGMPPADDGALQALTTGDEEELGDEVPTVGEKQAPWSICPECGSSDVDVTKEEDGGIHGNCNGCGAEYEALVKKTVEFKIVKPTKSVGEEGGEIPEGPEGPEEIPALPVAAQTKIDKNSIVRIAANREANGDVCPSCGNTHCPVVASGNGQTKCECGQCGTAFQKNLIISSSDPSKGLLRVEWNVTPNESCPECKEEAKKFASKLKVAGMLKTAKANSEQFPMSNCMERIARTYGGNTVARFGPCKGKPMADCVCNELEKLGFTKVRQLNKLAEVSMQEDPMDTCVKEQEEKGHDVVEAKSICNCLKKKFASVTSDNIYAQAFAEEAKTGKIPINSYDLNTLNDMYDEEKEYFAKKAQAILDEVDIGDSLDPLDSIEVEVEEIDELPDSEESAVESVTITGDNLEVVVEDGGGEDDVEFSDESELADDLNDNEGEEDMETFDANSLAEALAMTSSRVRRSGAESNLKLAGKPKLIETIEKDVEAGVPRSNATIRNEGADNIDVKMAKPSVPRSSALMGQEANVPAGLPDVPVDSSYMGGEKEIQSGMPAINNEIKGTVIAQSVPPAPPEINNPTQNSGTCTTCGQAQGQGPAGPVCANQKCTNYKYPNDPLPSIANSNKGMVIAQAEKNLIEAQKRLVQAKKLKEVDSVDCCVEVPRSNATMGNEGADNIDVKMATPSVPRSSALMGQEENISAEAPDVPISNAYMGGEKDAQSGMPGTNDKYLTQVAKREEQLERIASARRDEALRTTAWLASNGRIASDKDTFDNVVKALANFEVDKIVSTAETMFPAKAVKTASTQPVVKTAGLGLPALVLASAPVQEATFQNKLEGAFTIGSHNLNNKLIDDEQR